MRSEEELAEERRLCYVGMTRAMQKLYLLNAESRQLRGSTNVRFPSRFLREVPAELMVGDTLVNSVKPAIVTTTQALPTNRPLTSEFKLGREVRHEYFGEGIITGFDGDGEYMSVQVRFKKYGTKMLSPKFVHIKNPF
jgi:Superfamily I DNA and RNA helicases